MFGKEMELHGRESMRTKGIKEVDRGGQEGRTYRQKKNWMLSEYLLSCMN